MQLGDWVPGHFGGWRRTEHDGAQPAPPVGRVNDQRPWRRHEHTRIIMINFGCPLRDLAALLNLLFFFLGGDGNPIASPLEPSLCRDGQ